MGEDASHTIDRLVDWLAAIETDTVVQARRWVVVVSQSVPPLCYLLNLVDLKGQVGITTGNFFDPIV